MGETIELYQKRFSENPSYENYSLLVMANLRSPDEDYLTAIKVVEQNYSHYSDRTLVFIAASLAINWQVEPSKWVGILSAFVDDAKDREKAIIYYLKACFIEMADGRSSPEYRSSLEKSIEFSAEIKFHNNYRNLANISSGKEKDKWKKKAKENVWMRMNDQQIKELKDDYFLDPNMWVNEHILGIIRM